MNFKLLSALLLFSASAYAEPSMERAAGAKLSAAERRSFAGPYEMVVCIESSRLNVRSNDLRRVLFQVPNYSVVKVFQGWGENKKTRMIHGEQMLFIKVQVQKPKSGEAEGWVAEDLVRPRSRCEGAEQVAKPLPPLPEPKPDLSEQYIKPAPAEEKKPVRGTGLNDPNCCQFPLRKEPTADFNDGMRKFGARRSGGKRLHAASDLYSARNEPILAVAYGKVARAPYYFYQGTYAIEVTHVGGFVVRYGEINGKQAPGIHPGRYVEAGQPVGYMGKTDCCTPMLHFELYSGAKKGSLNSGANKYQRRGDLMNPTKYLQSWQESQFKIRK